MPPQGYVFVCPFEDLRTGPSSFRWPDCPAYWSPDPGGVERLGTDEATRLGFPSIAVEAEILCKSWDATVYAGLWKFHEAKGFGPESPDVARHLGYPVYDLSDQTPAPSFIERQDSDTADGEERNYPVTVTDEGMETSRTCRLVMSKKFALMFFLALRWLCDMLS
ncbi:hypothetical protein B0H10DRAFT_2067723 [Mycena sp. CBHHK59/15]|nr:hypothetical protein B0H10DRAFT_2067723 [Mycena sp. CBHHK59/15]